MHLDHEPTEVLRSIPRSGIATFIDCSNIMCSLRVLRNFRLMGAKLNFRNVFVALSWVWSHASTGRSTVSQTSADQLTEEHVIWGYRLFLDREPENLKVVRGKVANQANTKALRLDFMNSYEFRVQNPELGNFMQRNIVLKEFAEGLRLYIDLADHLIGLSVARGDYEVSEVEFIRTFVRPGQTVLDIGANIGFIAVNLGALVGPEGCVYAYEPVLDNFELLNKSLVENKMQSVVVTSRSAVSDTGGTMDLIVPTHSMNSGGSFLDTTDIGLPPGHRRESVAVVALDNEKLRRPVSFMKIDVEGAELLALRGARRLLEEDHPTILCEINTQQLGLVSNCTPTQFIAEIESMGYKCHLLNGSDLQADTGDLDRPGVRSVVFSLG